jgi:hypothetical protein
VMPVGHVVQPLCEPTRGAAAPAHTHVCVRQEVRSSCRKSNVEGWDGLYPAHRPLNTYQVDDNGASVAPTHLHRLN